MKTKFSALLFLGLLASKGVIAGGVGNGGDAIVCKDGVYLLDSIEMTQREMRLSLPGKTLREKVAGARDKLAPLDPYRHGILSETAELLLKDMEERISGDMSERLTSVHFSNSILSDVPDSLEISIPQGCQKEQLVNQSEPVFSTDRRFTIRADLWDSMDLDQKALTVLHEAWYTVFIHEGAGNSRFARYVNSVFASTQTATPMSKVDYHALLKFGSRLGLPAHTFESFLGEFAHFELFGPVKHRDGVSYYPLGRYHRGGIYVNGRTHRTQSKMMQLLGVTYDKNGVPLFVVKVAHDNNDFNETVSYKNVSFGHESDLSRINLFLDEAGEVKAITGDLDFLEIGDKLWVRRPSRIDARLVDGKWEVKVERLY